MLRNQALLRAGKDSLLPRGPSQLLPLIPKTDPTRPTFDLGNDNRRQSVKWGNELETTKIKKVAKQFITLSSSCSIETTIEIKSVAIDPLEATS